MRHRLRSGTVAAHRVPDDRLRLIFTCCHPALAAGSAGGADAADARRPDDRRRSPAPSSCRSRRWRSGWYGPSARSATPASRTGCRPTHLLPERLAAVLAVLYLLFNEGYAATRGDDLVRPDLCAEAIRLARLLVD